VNPLAALVCALTLAGVALLAGSPAADAPAFFFRDRLAEGGEGPEMALIPAGRFRMGDLSGDGDFDERPVREVSVPAFALARREITFADYERFAAATGAPVPDDSGFGRDDHPVVNLTWGDAVAYTAWLARASGRRYRLPSEAEWEYAARAGTTTRYWWGDEPGEGRAVCSGCRGPLDADATAPAGRLAPNPFGLFDVHGNVWEWTADCYAPYPATASDARPHIVRDCGQKVIRGGSWVLPPHEMRSSNRWRFYPVAPGDEIGFRVARDLERGE
jgi:formylglycine-generating enzyme required for sulfatase activity